MGDDSRHVANVFEEGELDWAGTVAESATVQGEESRQVERRIEPYHLDVISKAEKEFKWRLHFHHLLFLRLLQ